MEGPHQWSQLSIDRRSLLVVQHLLAILHEIEEEFRNRPLACRMVYYISSWDLFGLDCYLLSTCISPMPGGGTSRGDGLGSKTRPEPQAMIVGGEEVETIASCASTPSVVEGTSLTAEDP